MLFGGTFTLIAGNITKAYLCARALKNDVQNDAAFAYMALVVNAQAYLRKGTVYREDLYAVCKKNAQEYGSDIVEFLTHVAMDTEYRYFLVDSPRMSPYDILGAIYKMQSKIEQAVIQELRKCKPGALVYASTKTVLDSDYKLNSEADRLASEVNLYFD